MVLLVSGEGLHRVHQVQGPREGGAGLGLKNIIIPNNFISINTIYIHQSGLKRRHFYEVTGLYFVQLQVFLITSPEIYQLQFYISLIFSQKVACRIFLACWIVGRKVSQTSPDSFSKIRNSELYVSRESPDQQMGFTSEFSDLRL